MFFFLGGGWLGRFGWYVCSSEILWAAVAGKYAQSYPRICLQKRCVDLKIQPKKNSERQDVLGRLRQLSSIVAFSILSKQNQMVFASCAALLKKQRFNRKAATRTGVLRRGWESGAPNFLCFASASRCLWCKSEKTFGPYLLPVLLPFFEVAMCHDSSEFSVRIDAGGLKFQTPTDTIKHIESWSSLAKIKPPEKNNNIQYISILYQIGSHFFFFFFFKWFFWKQKVARFDYEPADGTVRLGWRCGSNIVAVQI